jgi:CheY-like chemotaxis protein
LLIVRDDGQGMDHETRERIFEPCFSTLSSNRSEGLGLAAVHRIIVEHGGTISVQSDPGRGSEFIIRLPTATGDIKDASESNTPPSVAQPRAQGAILVVEDNPLVRDLTVRALEGQGYCVRSAADAKECIAALPNWNQTFDLLLTDVVMPDMNGKALYEVLAARYGQLKVVYMSGYSQEFISQQHQIDSDAAFLQKPFSMRRLIATVRHAFAE